MLYSLFLCNIRFKFDLFKSKYGGNYWYELTVSFLIIGLNTYMCTYECFSYYKREND